MRTKLFPIVLGIMAIAFVYLRIKQTVAPAPNLPTTVIRIGEVSVTVEIADTPPKRAQGLSGREPLPELYGMLFPMGEPLRHTFWMKDMKFALDIIWINQGVIVDISENVPAPVGDEAPAVVQPSEASDTVLEVNADFTEKYGVKLGDEVDI